MAALLCCALLGCGARNVVPADGAPGVSLDVMVGPDLRPSTPPSGVDLLFVIDNSASTEQYQANLVVNFPELLRVLWREGRSLPSLHIGVVSEDLGAGAFSLPSCEVPGGEGGRLLATPRIPGCSPPADPWISHSAGRTNVPAGSDDPVERVAEAFRCIAQLGCGGCGFEHTLEAGRRALDPAHNVNPGFLRPDTLLVVVFVGDEDDCSAARPELFDPSQQSPADPLGPLTSFRCTEFGLVCDETDLRAPGVKHNCRPGKDWLQPVEGYVSFFRKLRPPGRVILAALAGPVSRVEVGLEGQNPVLRPTCQSANGTAVPALRIHSVVQAFGSDGLFNQGITYGKIIDVPNCASDFSPALRLLGAHIAARL